MGEAIVDSKCIFTGTSAEEVMSEAKELLRVYPDCVPFSLDCEANGYPHQEVNCVACVSEFRGAKTLVDRPLSL